MSYEELISKLDKWMEALNLKEIEKWGPELADSMSATYSYKENKKYIRVVAKSCNSESAFAFVDYDGNVYKCAGWKAPAKGIRGHIDNPPMSLGAMYR